MSYINWTQQRCQVGKIEQLPHSCDLAHLFYQINSWILFVANVSTLSKSEENVARTSYTGDKLKPQIVARLSGYSPD